MCIRDSLKAVKLVLEGGLSVREAGCHLGCGRSQVHLWVTLFEQMCIRDRYYVPEGLKPPELCMTAVKRNGLVLEAREKLMLTITHDIKAPLEMCIRDRLKAGKAMALE